MSAIQSAKGGKAHDPRYKDLIDKLVQARKEKGLSQEGLAKTLGRHQQFVSRYETGERRLDVVEFVDIARTLDVSMKVLDAIS
ncbi:helix-turn-helix transcriptional regulator [Sphingobium sp. CR2-8]|uniref:helix-turn-helix domain-containing protein n=1 Tax=Sphingobium sp. CR2-8 TaxID=1306534 RepID=UPI002DB832EA|nr:helix-turn-helix transcriptional regulator [Sphingobium sp. CR2-8]MEC3911526.1 helix-turn-helix transcriptional regulator [Sphingobium sp. CR2-8]